MCCTDGLSGFVSSQLHYTAPWWLPGGNAQTIWSAKCARPTGGARPQFQRERWSTPDGDFVDVDFLQGAHSQNAKVPLLVLFHGLEGSSQSAYAQAFADVAAERGWRFAVPHFRGCSGEMNLTPRAYHSGDFEEIDWLLARFGQLRASSNVPLYAAGVSLGGNALARWAGMMGSQAATRVNAVSSICSPLDLAASGSAIDRGFNRQVYARMFLRTLIPKGLAKLERFPGLFDRERLLAARDLYAFDDVYTAPLHGFKNTDDYWGNAGAKPVLRDVRVPALIINALNDPFVPASSLPKKDEVSSSVQLWQPEQGGHVGFATGGFPAHVRRMPALVADWLEHNR